MELLETTISEHIFNQGMMQGKIEGIEEQIAILEGLFRQGVLSEEQTEKILIPLRRKLGELKPGNN